MAKTQFSDTDVYEDLSDDNSKDDLNEYSDFENDNMTSENVNSSIMASDFDPEKVLYSIKKVLLGFENRDNQWVRVSEPLARTEFIMLYTSSIRSLVNFHNMFSQTSPEEAAFSMLESLKEITFACVDYGVHEEHLETLVNIYDTLKNTFMGIIINGRGTENVKQVLTSVYKDLSDSVASKNTDTGIINWEQVNKRLK